SHLVFGVVVDVLVHVAVELLESSDVGRTSSGEPREFVVLGSAEFGILQPEIGLDQLHRGEELEDGNVAPGQALAAAGRRGPGGGHQSGHGKQRAGSSRSRSVAQEGATVHAGAVALKVVWDS